MKSHKVPGSRKEIKTKSGTQIPEVPVEHQPKLSCRKPHAEGETSFSPVWVLESWTWPLDQEHWCSGSWPLLYRRRRNGWNFASRGGSKMPASLSMDIPNQHMTNTEPLHHLHRPSAWNILKHVQNFMAIIYQCFRNAQKFSPHHIHTIKNPNHAKSLKRSNILQCKQHKKVGSWGGGEHIYIYLCIYIHTSISIYTHLYTYIRRLIYLHIIFNAKKAGTSGFHVCNWAIFFCQRGSRGALCESSPSKSYGISAQCALVERKRKTHIRCFCERCCCWKVWVYFLSEKDLASNDIHGVNPYIQYSRFIYLR